MPLVIQGVGGWTLLHPTLWQRFHARLRSSSLDVDLARGASPEAGPLLAIRAAYLVRPRTRLLLARGLRRSVWAATAGGPPAPTLPFAVRRRIAHAGGDIARLADALARPGPLPSRAVARTALLLTDPTSPLHTTRGTPDLAGCVHDILIDVCRTTW